MPNPDPHEQKPTRAPPAMPGDDTALALISSVLDFVRGNLSNILTTWGRDSPQYQSARAIMQAYLAENVDRIKRQSGDSRSRDLDGEIESLMQGLSLDGEDGGGGGGGNGHRAPLSDDKSGTLSQLAHRDGGEVLHEKMDET